MNIPHWSYWMTIDSLISSHTNDIEDPLDDFFHHPKNT
jgi:hypothetical protein